MERDHHVDRLDRIIRQKCAQDPAEVLRRGIRSVEFLELPVVQSELALDARRSAPLKELVEQFEAARVRHDVVQENESAVVPGQALAPWTRDGLATAMPARWPRIQPPPSVRRPLLQPEVAAARERSWV